MKLEVGKWYKARNSLRAFVKSNEQIPKVQKYYFNEKGLKTFVKFGDERDNCIEIATVVYSDNSIRRVYKRNGKIIDNFLGFESSYDLIEEWKDDLSELVDKDQTERSDGNNCVSMSYGVHNVSVISEIGEYETSASSPIQEKIVKELVPGVYGLIEIIEEDENTVLCAVTNYMTSSELRAAAKTFNEIADYLDEQK